ncbi:MAG: hypothetical protein D6813_14230, partial [Calditrichaeota bacterium]
MNFPTKKFWLIFILLFAFSSTYAQVFKGPQSGKTKLIGIVNFKSLPQSIESKTKINISLGQGPSNETATGKNAYLGITNTEIDEPNGTLETVVNDQLFANFEGIQQTDYEPPDPVIAAGTNYIVIAVNSTLAIYTKNGTKISQTDFSDFFNNNIDDLFDPKIIYDHYDKRWVLLVIERNELNQTSNYLIAVSQSSDPTGSWYKYESNACLNGSNSTQLWADYPGLGYDDNAIYITSNQYSFSQNLFQYAKLRIFKKSELYGGSETINYTDFWNMKNSDNSKVFTLKPAHHFGTTNSAYLLNTKWYSGASITLWRIDNPTNSPTLVRQATVSVGSYSAPPDAKQKDSNILISVNRVGTRTQDVVYREGKIYTAFQTGYNWGNGTVSAIKYEKIDVINNTVDIDAVYGSDNEYYYYPNIYVDAYNDIFLVFGKSSSSEYAGIYWAYRTPTDTRLRKSQPLKEGEGVYTGELWGEPRWGDYSGICLDGANNNQIWFYGEWAKSNGEWSTQVGSFRFAPVQFSNLNENNSDLGGQLLINSVLSVISGTEVGFQPNSENTVKTLASGDVNNPSDRFDNNKHNNWNKNNLSYLISNNFTAFDAPNQSQKAYFKQLFPAVVTIYTLENLSTNNKELSFNDPWYLNSDGTQGNNFASHTVPLNKTNVMTGAYNQSTGGVFLDQNPDPNDPNKPYYSVKADAQQTFKAHGENITGYFLGWEGTQVDFEYPDQQETAVVFHSENAEARAVYKGHLASSIARASGYNNGRRICKTNDGKLHLVYEDDNTIWYTYSTDNGHTWAKEYAISPRPYSQNSIAHSFKNPSIATNGSNLYVVFEEVVQNNSSTN